MVEVQGDGRTYAICDTADAAEALRVALRRWGSTPARVDERSKQRPYRRSRVLTAP